MWAKGTAVRPAQGKALVVMHTTTYNEFKKWISNEIARHRAGSAMKNLHSAECEVRAAGARGGRS
jgi:hypothetical protein